MLFDRLLGAASEEMTSALLNLVMDASVLLGTVSPRARTGRRVL